MADRDEIVRYLDETLEAAQYRDHLPLGLQVPGADEVRHVCTAVSASLDVFERAAAAGAQMLVVHHGLFWDGSPRRIGDARAPAARDAVPPRPVAGRLPPAARRRTTSSATTRCSPRCSACSDVEPFGDYRGTPARPVRDAPGRRSPRPRSRHGSAPRSARRRWCSRAAPTRSAASASSPARRGARDRGRGGARPRLLHHRRARRGLALPRRRARRDADRRRPPRHGDGRRPGGRRTARPGVRRDHRVPRRSRTPCDHDPVTTVAGDPVPVVRFGTWNRG